MGRVKSLEEMKEMIRERTGKQNVFRRAKREDVEPVIAPAYQIGVLKGALHPNAGHLFAAFLTFPEGQEVWEKYTGQTSALIPGTGT